MKEQGPLGANALFSLKTVDAYKKREQAPPWTEGDAMSSLAAITICHRRVSVLFLVHPTPLLFLTHALHRRKKGPSF